MTRNRAANWRQAAALPKGAPALVVLPVEHGFETDTFVLLAEQDILGDRLARPRKKRKASSVLSEAAALTPGMRAVTVSVSAATSVAGFVFPGDRVDVLLSQEIAGGDGGAPLKAAETIVRNVRVLATDQRTDNQPDSEGKTDVKGFSLVTMEATPKLAEKIAVAEKIGTRAIQERLTKLIPFIGVVSGGALNYAVVYAVGRSATRYYESLIDPSLAEEIWAEGDREHA